MKGLLPWLKEAFFGEPPHCCQEFTQWKACVQHIRIVASAAGSLLPENEQYEVTSFFQERRCTLCGKVFQEPLEFDSEFDSDETE